MNCFNNFMFVKQFYERWFSFARNHLVYSIFTSIQCILYLIHWCCQSLPLPSTDHIWRPYLAIYEPACIPFMKKYLYQIWLFPSRIISQATVVLHGLFKLRKHNISFCCAVIVKKFSTRIAISLQDLLPILLFKMQYSKYELLWHSIDTILINRSWWNHAEGIFFFQIF